MCLNRNVYMVKCLDWWVSFTSAVGQTFQEMPVINNLVDKVTVLLFSCIKLDNGLLG